MVELDQVEASMKKHRIREEAAKAKLERRMQAAGGNLEYKSDNESDDEYDRAAKAE